MNDGPGAGKLLVIGLGGIITQKTPQDRLLRHSQPTVGVLSALHMALCWTHSVSTRGRMPTESTYRTPERSPTWKYKLPHAP